MKMPKFDRNIAGHFFGLFISLFVGMGLVGIWQEGAAVPQDLTWSIGLFVFTAAVFVWQLRSDLRPKPTRSALSQSSPVTIQFNENVILRFYNGEPQEEVQWQEVNSIIISIEDAFLPFPYWYIGNGKTGIRMPNDAVGAKELMDEFAKRLPGYHSDDTYKILIEAMVAMEGVFRIWQRGSNSRGEILSPSSSCPVS